MAEKVLTDIEIVYADASVIVVNKPNDLLVHHSYYARNIREESLVQILRNECETYPVHRLDRKTSGIMIFAKDKTTAKYLQDQFEAKQVVKTYFALVRGFTDPEGRIDSPVKHADTGKYQDALTYYQTIESVEVDFPVNPYPTSRYSLVELSPKTGRMHQLRKHLNKISHPIIGDPKYGNRHHNHEFQERFGHAKLYLHANSLSLKLPDSNELKTFTATFPEFWKHNLFELNFKTQLLTHHS